MQEETDAKATEANEQIDRGYDGGIKKAKEGESYEYRSRYLTPVARCIKLCRTATKTLYMTKHRNMHSFIHIWKAVWINVKKKNYINEKLIICE